jgi:hypothetical protein
MNISSNETILTGKWISVDGEVRGDESTERIKSLVKSYLKQIAISPKYGAWEILYQDPNDKRYWEHTYPHSELQGGGPPMLINISNSEAKNKYDL